MKTINIGTQINPKNGTNGSIWWSNEALRLLIMILKLGTLLVYS